MANIEFAQDSFSKGELSPYMYARTKVNQYYSGLRTAQNVITYPQGAAGKRFGTLYNATLNGFTSADDVYFQTFQYLNECVYQILVIPNAIQIFLEGLQVATVTPTGLDAHYIQNMDYTVLENRFRITGPGARPKDLTRTANAANVITGVSSNQFTLTNAITVDLIYPVRFTNVGGALPTTTPQIKAGVTYFVKAATTTSVRLYSTSLDARYNENVYTLTNAGTGTNNLIILNTWALGNVAFKNLPVYDFDGGYDSITFTPSATSGAAVTLTASSSIFGASSTKFVGGAFVGGGGVGRITNWTSDTQVTIAVQQAFDSTAAISGRLSFLAEPAWSDLRGWPIKCSSFQTRALFANSDSLPNGFWASAINSYGDFNDLQADDDDAISWFPTSDEINFIRFLVPYRSLTVHTNSGVYSTPLSFESAITPTNFSLQLQDSTPSDVLQPQAIDNQIIVISGNDVHSLLWDGINNAYTSDIVSVMSEQVIRNPVDEAPYVDLNRAGSRYVFVINENGTLAIYQTLLTQSISGWTPNVFHQSYGNAYFRQCATNFNGRAWFLTERQLASEGAPVNITGFTSSTLTAVATNFDTEEATAVKFATTGSLPASTPILEIDTYYWVIGVTADTFKVYTSKVDADNDENSIVFTSAGTNSTVISWALATTFLMEELTFDTFLDCAYYTNGSAASTFTGMPRFNAQEVKMVGDGFGFSAEGNNDEITFEAHGSPVEVSEVYIGFPINMVIEPMPFAMPSASVNGVNIPTMPKHIRSVNFMFNNTIGGTVNGQPIAIKTFNQAGIGEPPVPARGIFEVGLMRGWNDFNDPLFTLEHDEPFNIELLGLFYSVEI